MWLLFLIFKIKRLIITEKIKVKNIVYVYNLILKKINILLLMTFNNVFI